MISVKLFPHDLFYEPLLSLTGLEKKKLLLSTSLGALHIPYH